MISKKPRRTLDLAAIKFTRYDDMGGIDFEAEYEGARIGVIRTLVDGDRMHLTALDVVERRPGWDNWIKRVARTLGILPSRRARRQGVATALLDRLLTAAGKAGVTEVWGEIVASDLAASPFLLEWYRRRGFDLLDPDDETSPLAVKKIVRTVHGA